jgi:hypothetical protein
MSHENEIQHELTDYITKKEMQLNTLATEKGPVRGETRTYKKDGLNIRTIPCIKKREEKKIHSHSSVILIVLFIVIPSHY